jgi:hypothetical protein
MRAAVHASSLTFAIALACAACTGRDAAHDTAAAATTAPSAVATMKNPAAPMTAAPASTLATSSSVATLPTTGPMPAEGAISFLGFGPAHWGASEEQVRQAWGKDMEASPAADGGCHYLFPMPRTEGGYRIAFMTEAGRFVRVDVRAADIVAPGGGRVGMDKAELHRLYPSITEQPHKYVEGGLNLRATDPQGGQGSVVFELDPAGKVTAWRVGVPPQVDYVEGCS